jgi:hypothetical protein
MAKSRIESRESTLMIFRFHLLKTWLLQQEITVLIFFILYSPVFFKNIHLPYLPTQNRLCEIRLS